MQYLMQTLLCNTLLLSFVSLLSFFGFWFWDSWLVCAKNESVSTNLFDLFFSLASLFSCIRSFVFSSCFKGNEECLLDISVVWFKNYTSSSCSRVLAIILWELKLIFMAIGTGAPNDTRKIGPNRNHIAFNIPSLIGISYLIPCSSSFFNLSFQSPISNFT